MEFESETAAKKVARKPLKRTGGKEKLDAHPVTFEQLAKEYRERKLIAPVYDNPHSDNRKRRKGRATGKIT